MGPLEGIKIIEIAGLGPGPFAAMLLADMGGEVVRIDRPGGQLISFPNLECDVLNRGRRSAAIDLKQSGGTPLESPAYGPVNHLLKGKLTLRVLSGVDGRLYGLSASTELGDHAGWTESLRIDPPGRSRRRRRKRFTASLTPSSGSEIAPISNQSSACNGARCRKSRPSGV